MKLWFNLIIVFLCTVALNEVALSEKPLRMIDSQLVADASRSYFMVKDQEAEDVLKSYLQALSSGDVRTIENLLSPKLLKKRQRLLRNPSYPDFLRKWYANARFEILGFKNFANNRIKVEVRVVLNDGESTRLGILLLKTKVKGQPETFHIHSDNARLYPPK